MTNTSSHSPHKLRVAIIGAGGISKQHVGGILEHQHKIECVALCDVSQENLKARSEQLGGVSHQFSDWNEMFQKAGSLFDAVIIALPHHLHTPAICDAVKAKKHILCEKPLCIDLEEADELVETVRNSDVTYMSAHNQLFIPVVREAKKMIDNGVLGKIRWIRVQDCYIPLQQEATFRGKWRAKKEFQGGGELIDTGYHPSYLMLHLAGSQACEVRSSMSRFVHEIEGEDTASVQIRFENGSLGEIFTSWAVPLPYGTHKIHVIGEKGQTFGSTNTLYHLPLGAKEAVKIELPEVKNTYYEQMGYFADCMLSGKKPIHSVEEGRDVLQLIMKATENAEGWQETAPKQFAEAICQ
jgi:predicted dehydrogenase